MLLGLRDEPMIYLHGATIYTSRGKIEQGAMICIGEAIRAIGRADELPCPISAQSIDLSGLSLVPGFIDLQINGAFGMDFTSNPDCIWQVGEQITRFGVIAFLPTIISSPDETIQHAQAVLQNGPPSNYQGARALGLHLEGPYLNPEKSGAHEPSNLRLPDPKVYGQWNPSTQVRMVTLAPELPGGIQAIKLLAEKGVLVSAGHSQASFNQAMDGIQAGIRYGTHLFNAMPPLDHREPGLAGALLGDTRCAAGMIVDGYHVHPTMVKLAWNSLGIQRTSLVTDAMAALSMPPGTYELGKRHLQVDGTTARLEDGRLAGSLLSLDVALRNLMEFTGCSLDEALPTITQVPARLLSLEPSIGGLKPGAAADFVILNSALDVVEVWINGRTTRPVE